MIFKERLKKWLLSGDNNENKDNKKEYELKFKKMAYDKDKFLNYKIALDSYILETLAEIQSKCDFDIVSVKIGDEEKISSIKIKCEEDKRNVIFMVFCVKMGNKICNISFG